MADLTSAYIPQIIEFSPTELSTSVNPRPEIKVRFTLDMLIGTLPSEDATQYLNEHAILVEIHTDAPHALAFSSYEPREKTLTFTTAEDLEPGATYALTLRAGFQSATGRGTSSDVTWRFTIAGTSVDRVQLISPIDASDLTSIPTIGWTALSVTPVTYQFQVADNPQLANPAYDAELSQTYFDSMSSLQIRAGTTYYWRARGKSNSIIGAWSETRSFRVKTAQAPGSLFDTLGLVSCYPPIGASNLSAFPTVTMTFNEAVDATSVATGVSVSAEHVDTGESQTAPDMTLSAAGAVLTISFTGDIAENTRYTVVALGVQSTSGDALSEPAIVSFTGPYTPLYSTARVLRGTYGRFLTRFYDEEVNFQLHRSSIKCNRNVNDAGSSAIETLLVAQTVTFDMEAYVQAHAAYCLIQSYLYEVLEQAGRRTQLDTLSAAVESRLIADIDALLKQLEKEVKRLEIVLKGAPEPKAGVRSEQWDPSQLYNDQSIGGLGRGKF